MERIARTGSPLLEATQIEVSLTFLRDQVRTRFETVTNRRIRNVQSVLQHQRKQGAQVG
jgi:hypothetical protein